MSHQSWRIRPMVLSDHAACLRVWTACEHLGDSPTLAALERFLHHNPSFSQIAEVVGGTMVEPDTRSPVIAAVLVSSDGIRGYIYRLGVHPSHRRQGIATALIQAAQHALSADGCDRTNLHLFSANAAAQDFWRGQGFAPTAGLEFWSRR